jgi:gamma-glutamyl:cysteine ligase YbdK (ATP-grasp superfamily)
MGQEIHESHFRKQDFDRFHRQLQQETEQLASLFSEQSFSYHAEVGGFEVEAWLVDKEGKPAAINEEYLRRLNDPMVVPELARFNVEMNTPAADLRGDVFSQMQSHLDQTWRHCDQVARDMDASLVCIGILPTVQDSDLTLANMSAMTRYRALNEQVLRQRQGRPLKFEINGHEHLAVSHPDVMLESAATSFQIHLQVPLNRAVSYYNAAIALSAPMVALSANSPYLFGKDLWAETRIPLFEQAVEVGGTAGAAFGPLRRVTYGSGYARDSMLECYRENLDHYPILLPIAMQEPSAELPHLRLHNGTIWRWNRPLIGFDEDGTPHLRVEHRVVSAGPSNVDMIANAAMFFGMAHYYVCLADPLERHISFAQSRDNFYNAARLGLQATMAIDDGHVPLRNWLLEELLPAAERGLEALEINFGDRRYYLDIIRERVESGQNGCHWQRAYVARYGRDMHELLNAYLAHQRTGEPVHSWSC